MNKRHCPAIFSSNKTKLFLSVSKALLSSKKILTILVKVIKDSQFLCVDAFPDFGLNSSLKKSALLCLGIQMWFKLKNSSFSSVYQFETFEMTFGNEIIGMKLQK